MPAATSPTPSDQQDLPEQPAAQHPDRVGADQLPEPETEARAAR